MYDVLRKVALPSGLDGRRLTLTCSVSLLSETRHRAAALEKYTTLASSLIE
jgi:hypothetical protein